MKLKEITLVLYCAEIATYKTISISTPPYIQEGLCITLPNTMVQIDKLIWIESTHLMVALCGWFGYHNGDGENGGSRMYFPFGHIPEEFFEKVDASWQIGMDEESDKAFLTPVGRFKASFTLEENYFV